MSAASSAARALAIESARVREANRVFYQAIENLSLEDMEAVWLQGPQARCVHPGWPMLSGWEAIRESWRAIFDNTSDLAVSIHDVNVNIEATVAWVTCLERIASSAHLRTDKAAVCATNVFVLTEGDWRMVLHHASHLPDLHSTGSETIQ
jgi:ketosteroid isomerase-like protein